MPTNSKNGKSQMLSARIPQELVDKLQLAAKEKNVPCSQIMIAAIREYLRKEESGD